MMPSIPLNLAPRVDRSYHGILSTISVSPGLPLGSRKQPSFLPVVRGSGQSWLYVFLGQWLTLDLIAILLSFLLRSYLWDVSGRSPALCWLFHDELVKDFARRTRQLRER